MPAKSSIGTSAVALSASSISVKQSTLVRADPNNTGILYIGGAGVTVAAADATDGIPLNPGESIVIPASRFNDVSKIYVIGSAAGQKAYWDYDLTCFAPGAASAGAFGLTLPTTGRVMDEAGNLLTVKVKAANVASSGVNVFIAAVTSKKIRVLALRLQNADITDVTLTFYDTAGSPAVIANSPTYVLGTGSDPTVVTAPAGGFEFQSASGAGVQLNLSDALSVNAELIYCEVP